MSSCDCPTFTMQPSVSSDFSLPFPTWNSADSSLDKDLTVMNMWSADDIQVVDRGLNDEPVVLIGVWRVCGEYEGLCFPICFPACFSRPLSDQVEAIWDMQNDGEEITIDDLSDCLNGVYIIEDFEFRTIRGTNAAYGYKFLLTKVRDLS